MNLRIFIFCEIYLYYSIVYLISYYGERNLFLVNNIIIREFKKDCVMLKKELDIVMSREKCILRFVKILI